MIRRLPILLSLSAAGLCAVAAGAAGAPPAPAPSGSAQAAATAPAPPPAAASGYHRVELPGAADKKFPYTVEVPQGWTVHEIKDTPALLWLGPEGGNPASESDANLVLVRLSPAELGKPEDVVAKLKQQVPADGSWTAPVVEVREVGGVRGVWVQMNTASGAATRKTLILKLPLPRTSVDFIARAAGETFDKMRPEYERILLSVRPLK
jgi:hypothetical protein